ncbi:MAG: helix-turn-helix transcriptional regulator [Firmicutes bacterium]|nr:helix-turn-helix transcriptional regulator [Candidatus Fiminaster equi]
MNTVERVKSILKERKIAVSRLEKDCGFSNGYIGQLRKGSIPDDRLRIIADYLNLSVEYLTTGKEMSMPEFEPEHLELIRLYSKLNKEQKNAIITMMRSLANEI